MGSSARHQLVISSSSARHQLVISSSSVRHQFVISLSSVRHQRKREKEKKRKREKRENITACIYPVRQSIHLPSIYRFVMPLVIYPRCLFISDDLVSIAKRCS